MTARTGDAGGTLDARYGRTPGSRRRERRWIWLAALAFVAIFAAWVVWGGLGGEQAQLEARTLGYEHIDERTVEVRWEVTTDAGVEARCAVQALNESFGIVGWKIVDIEVGSERTRRFTETLRTSEPAVTGLIYRCWLA